MAKINKSDISINVISVIVEILNRGHTCEVKKEKNNIVVVELRRKAKIKEIIISGNTNDNAEGTATNTKLEGTNLK